MLTPRTTPSPRFNQLITGHFKEGRGYVNWREKGTDDWLLIYTMGGRGRFGYYGGELTANEGDIVLIQPGTMHDYGVEPEMRRWELLWAHFHPRPHWHEWLEWPKMAPGLMALPLQDPPMRRRIASRFAEAHRLASGAFRRREALGMNALEEVLLWCDTQNPLAEPSWMDPRIRRAMDYLCLHLQERISLSTLAEASGLSVSRLAHLFREQVGLTPQQYLEQQRMSRARQLLELSPRPVQAIAYELGYDNPFYFTIRFKKDTGLSPREYRKREAARG